MARCALALFVLACFGARHAAAEGSGSAGSAAPAAPAAPGDDEEEAGGSGAALVAPKDAKAAAGWLRAHVAEAIASRAKPLGKAKIGAYAVDLATGAELVAHEADHGMNLASATKLLTSVAALGTLGGGFRWRTAAYVDDLDDATGDVKGDLYVRGRGDPTLTPADLRALADDIAARGVRSVAGQLVLDTTYFDADVDPPHFADQPKERAGYRAPVAALGVAKSAVTVIVEPEPGATAHVRLEPAAGDYVRIVKNEVKTVAEGKTRVRVDARPKADHLELDVSGQIRVADGTWDKRFRVEDPARFAAEVLRAALFERGVKIAKRGFAAHAVPPAAKLVAAHDSVPLATVVHDMNKASDNYLAESVLKTLGAETRTTPGPATWADGIAAVRAALAKIGLQPNTYRADNGSGLYAASEVTAREVVVLLRAAHSDFRIGPDLVASLPVGGQDGTLAKRWHDRPARGRVRAKTGTLDKVIALAGYVGVDGGHLVAFAVVVNDIPAGQRAAARALGDDIVDALVAYLDATH